MKTILGLLLFISLSAHAVYEVGDKVENLCWNSIGEQKVCLDSFASNVVVLLYNSGWCGPCNDEFSELVPQVFQFDGEAVKFVSLSAAGWEHSSTPDEQFLTEWRDEHAIPFTVAASPKDAGKKFIAPPISIPNVAIIDKDGNLAFKGIAPGVDAILEEVKRLIRK